MNLDPILQAMEASPGSVAIRESTLLYPVIETTHVLALCVFLGLIALLDLRLTGLGLGSVPVSEIAGKILPWALFGFAIMAVSGGLLFYSGPVKAAANIFFRVKVVMIALTGLNALLFHFTIFRKVNEWDRDPMPPSRARMAGMFSLILWCGVVVCGRMQAYNWFTQ
jgi:hypothetical protein